MSLLSSTPKLSPGQNTRLFPKGDLVVATSLAPPVGSQSLPVVCLPEPERPSDPCLGSSADYSGVEPGLSGDGPLHEPLLVPISSLAWATSQSHLGSNASTSTGDLHRAVANSLTLGGPNLHVTPTPHHHAAHTIVAASPPLIQHSVRSTAGTEKKKKEKKKKRTCIPAMCWSAE
ncbi:unnamed protein product [Diplocarpon coronariae]